MAAALGAAGAGLASSIGGAVISGEYGKAIADMGNQSNQKIATANNTAMLTNTDKQIAGQKANNLAVQQHTENQFAKGGLPSYMAYTGSSGGNSLNNLPKTQYHLAGNNYYQSSTFGSVQPQLSNNFQQYLHVGTPTEYAKPETRLNSTLSKPPVKFNPGLGFRPATTGSTLSKPQNTPIDSVGQQLLDATKNQSNSFAEQKTFPTRVFKPSGNTYSEANSMLPSLSDTRSYFTDRNKQIYTQFFEKPFSL